MSSEFIKDIISENYTSEVHFAICDGELPSAIIRSITHNVTSILRSLYVLSGLAFIIFLCSDWKWSHTSLAEQRILLALGCWFVWTLLTEMPQRITMTPGSEECAYSWGMGSFAVRFVVPVTQIKGIYLTTNSFGNGKRLPCLALAWSAPRTPFFLSQPFVFARYSDMEMALEGAREISEVTGLPIIEATTVTHASKRKS